MNDRLMDVILTQREWSWSVIGIISICFGLLIRAFLLRDVLHSMKIRNRSWYKRTLVYYQKKSILGWIFFAASMIGIMLIWWKESLFLKHMTFSAWMFLFIFLFFLAVFFHLKAYAKSIVEALQENVALDKEL